MASFDSFSLDTALLQTVEEAGLARPTALQEAMIPVARRGGNFIAVGSKGSGKTLGYGLSLLDRMTSEDGLRALVLRPTPEATIRTAEELSPFATVAGATLTVPGGGWRTEPAEADIVVTTIADVLRGVSVSQFKVDDFAIVVVDGADDDHADPLDTIFDLAHSESQRIVVMPSRGSEVERVLERRVKRAKRFPVQPIGQTEADLAPEGEIRYVVTEDANVLEALTRLLVQVGGVPALFLPTAEEADSVSELLASRGFLIGHAPDEEIDVLVPDDPAEVPEGAPTISVYAPADEAQLIERHDGEGDAIVLITPGERTHLFEIARRARRLPRLIPIAAESDADAEVSAYRDRVRKAVRQEDLGAQITLLEPLFDEFGAIEVAAALSALVRQRSPAQETAARESRPTAGPAGQERAAKAPASFTRLFISLGHRDGARPGDIVGSIAGEAEIEGAKIGKVEIRDTFSIVEVDASVAERVIRALNGTTVKGRSLRVDYDRGGQRPPTRRPARRSDRGGGERPGG